LSTATEIKTVAGEFGTLEQDARILQYEWKCKNRQLSENTIKKRKYYLNRLVRDGADLDKPESVESVLATHYPTATRWVMVIAYRSYCKLFNIPWDPVKVKYQPKMPYMPTEEECRIFIAAMPKVLTVFCQTLFETGARVGELTKVERQDVNEEECKIAIRCPEKGSNPRMIKVSRECIGLLMTLPKKHEPYLFCPEPLAYYGNFQLQRKKAATKLNKPEFLKIHFHTFRHMRGTLDVHNHVPLFEVKEKLGHKCICNTEKYVHWNRQLYDAKSDRYHFAAVSTIEEAGKLIETGYEFVTDMEGMKLFRKPK
jgi:integrase